MEIQVGSTNVVGMKMTVLHRYLQDRSQVIEVHTLAEVWKTQKSNAGFKTSTGTVRTCRQCRESGEGVSGVKPWPVAVWLLTAKLLGNGEMVQLALCSNHFRKLRERSRGVDITQFIPEEGVDLSGVWGGSSMVFNPDFDSDGSPWVPVSPPE